MSIEMEFEVQDFDKDVIETSRTTPVLVDFWAPWCGPCRVLGPVLERLASEANGTWELVKVNTDQHPEVSSSYGIRGIPAVKLFVEGAVHDEFTGALPEYAVRQWLEKALPSESKEQLRQAEEAAEQGRAEEARMLLENVLEMEPANARAGVLLAQLIAFEDPERAGELVAGGAFAGPGFIQIEEAVRTVTRLFGADLEELPESPVKGGYAAGIEALKARDFEDALRRFIEVIQSDRYYDDDGARKACVAIFTLLGEGHPAVRAYRRRFDMALY
jgi:putative thioredoxin